MIVASVLMSLGMMMLSPVLVALPFKLMLFVLADGWNLLVGSLAHSPLNYRPAAPCSPNKSCSANKPLNRNLRWCRNPW